MYTNRFSSKKLTWIVIHYTFIPVLFTLYLPCGLKAQGKPDIQLPKVVAPEAAAIMKFVNYPVSLCYGLPDISIPLYELTEGEICIPITLSYHSSGLKVRDDSGRVGLGWNLNMEPIISRQINGIPDEKGYLNAFGWWDYDSMRNFLNYEALADGTSERDEDPDAFYYKLPDKSGKFYFKRGGTLKAPTKNIEVITVPFEPIKVEYSKSNQFTYFNITDDKGYFYRFGKSLSGDANVYGCTDPTTTTHWKATEMISPNKRDTVYFKYSKSFNERKITWNLIDYIAVEEFYDIQRPGVTGTELMGCSHISIPVLVQCTNYNTKANALKISQNPQDGEYYASIGELCSSWHYPFGGGSTGTTLDVSLKSIETRNIKIEITNSNYRGDYELSRIDIKHKNGNGYKLIRSIYFYISNYNETTNIYKRKLDAVMIADSQGTIIEKYSFSYYNEHQVPSLTNKNMDHWGYYNGTSIDINDNAVPYQEHQGEHMGYSYNLPIGRGYKKPSSEHAKIGMLQSITYPTGRKSTFYYQSNMHMGMIDTDWEIVPTGGLRISKIKEYDPITSKTISRIFTYGENEDGAGMLRYNITLDDYREKKVMNYYISNDVSGINLNDKVTIYHSNPLFAPSFSSGSPVYYQYATERLIDESRPNTPLGKTVYEYNPTLLDIHHISGTSLVFDSDQMSWKMGKLIKKTIYEYLEKDTLYRPIKSTTYTYDEYKATSLEYAKTYRRIHFIDDGYEPDDYIKSLQVSNYNGFTRETAQHYSGCMRLTSEKTDTYVNGELSLTQERIYNYGNQSHMLPTKTIERNSNGTIVTTQNKYPQDVQYSDYSEESSRKKLIDYNRLNTLLEKVTFTNTDTKLWVEKISYQNSNNLNAPMPYKVSNGYNNNLEVQLTIHQYDSFGNPAYATLENNSGIGIVYIWGYKGKYLVAEIKNTTYEQVKNALTEQTIIAITNGKEITNSIRDILNAISPNIQVTTYKYQPLIGVSEITDPAGVTFYYEYDNAGRLKEVSIKEKQSKKIIQLYDYKYRNKE